MTLMLSPNTQAILLLTAPLIAGRGSTAAKLLTPGEYQQLARHLRGLQHEPADLLSPDAEELLVSCGSIVDRARLEALLRRGFLLSQVVEQWSARNIWVLSRADSGYPQQLKARLREYAPAVIYGCGHVSLLSTGGLAVVGSRDLSSELVSYTQNIGSLAARSGVTLISGGAKGADQAALRGVLDGGGAACCVLAGDLASMTTIREYRDSVMAGRLTLVSPYDPSSSWKSWQAMQRNKLIYALSDASLVIDSGIGSKSGTWTGAVEQLESRKLAGVPVFVRSTGEVSAGLDALRDKGALPWPNPEDEGALREVIALARSEASDALSGTKASPLGKDVEKSQESLTLPILSESINEGHRNEQAPTPDVTEAQLLVGGVQVLHDDFQQLTGGRTDGLCSAMESVKQTPAEILLETVRVLILDLLRTPMSDVEVAKMLGVSNDQAKRWLQRLLEEGVVEKTRKPVAYLARQRSLL